MANKKVSQLTSKPSVLTTDLFPIADPSTGQLFKTTISDLGTAIGSGVSSVNSLVGAVVLDTDDIQELVSPTNKWFTDTRARAALSASSPLTYNSGTGAFGIQVANGSQNGYLSSTDWTTFNNKLSTASAASTYVPYTGATGNVDIGNFQLSCNGVNVTHSALGYTVTGPTGFGDSAVLYSLTGFGNLFGVDGSFSTKYFGIKTDGTFVHNGGNAVFSSNISAVDATFSGNLTVSSTNPRIYLTDTDNNPDYFISNTDGTFTVYDVTNSTARFTIGTTGNVNFTNAITGGGSITGESLYSNGIVSVGTYLVMPANNTVGGTNYYIGQQMAGSDYWRIFGNSVSADQGELVFSLGDNGVPIASNGQRFRFYYDASADGTSKDALIIDYNTSTFTTSLVATGATLTGALSGTSATFSSTLTAGTILSNTISPISGNLTIALAGASNNLLITGGNNVGIGLTSPQSALDVLQEIRVSFASANQYRVRIYNTDGNGRIFVDGDTTALIFGTSPSGVGAIATEKMRITSSGNVLVGTTSETSGYKLQVNGLARVINTNTALNFGELDASNVYFQALNTASSASKGFVFYGTGEYMRITSGGNVLIGTTTDYGSRLVSYGVDASSSNYSFRTINSNGIGTFAVRNDGAIYAPGVYNFTTGSAANVVVFSDGSMQRSTSSIKYKKNVENYTKGLSELMQLRAVTYEGKGQVDAGKTFAGLIAEEVHDLGLTEFVQYAEDGTPDALAYQNMVSLLIKGIQELKAELDTLKNK